MIAASPDDARQRKGAWRQAIGRRAVALVEYGTGRYPTKTRRRLRNLNVAAYTIAVSCLLFAFTYGLEDAELYRGAVIANLGMMVAMLAVPALNRVHDIGGPMFMALALLGGLFLIVAMVGRESGIQINFVAASVLAFLGLELKRLHYIAAIIAVGIALHIAAWLFFRQGMVDGTVSEAFLLRLYITTVVTISIIVAVVVYYAFWTAEQAEAETEMLLHRILPVPVAERLKARPDEAISDSFPEAGVLFSDLVGFVPIARSLGAVRTVEMLNRLVHRFDRLAADHGVEKIKTIGDAYMAATIREVEGAGKAARLARMSLAMQGAADATGEEFGAALRLRIGIAFGPVMAGVIGAQRFTYDIWGDAVNLAARLENAGEPGRIHVSAAFRDALADAFAFERRGGIEIKGVGRIETWFLVAEGKEADRPARASIR
jgi:adenylate cyclase